VRRSPARLFRQRLFTVSNTAMVVVGFALMGSSFFFSQFFVYVQGSSILRAGLQTLPISLAMVIVSPYAGRLAAKHGFRIVVTIGLALAGLGLLALGFVHADTGYGNVWWRLAIAGVGFALTMSPLTGAAIQAVSPQEGGLASGVSSTTRQIGAVLGVALLGVIVHTRESDGASFESGLNSAFLTAGAVTLVCAVFTCPTLICAGADDGFFKGRPEQLYEHLTCPQDAPDRHRRPGRRRPLPVRSPAPGLRPPLRLARRHPDPRRPGQGRLNTMETTMTPATSVIDQIDRALDMTGVITKGITDELLALPTPCPGWDVRTELNHLVGGMRIFAAELTATDPGAAHEDDWLGDDPQAAYAAAADLDRAAWHRPGVLKATVRLGFGDVPGPMASSAACSEAPHSSYSSTASVSA
jgi:hypothetical protein